MSSINHLESIDSGSNYRFGNKMEVTKPPRSLFDLGHLVTCDIPREGIVYPLSIIQTNPAEDFDISADCLLRVMPQVVPLYSRMRMYIYGFYSRFTDLWDEADVFITRGYTGNETNLRIPTLNSNNVYNYYIANGSGTHHPTVYGANSLWDYFGLPQGINRFESTPESTGYYPLSNAVLNANINALPFMMYLRIWRDYFINKNHYINNRLVLPNDDSRFRLNSNGELLSAKDLSKSLKFCPYATDPVVGFSSNNFLFGLFTHLWPSDYFTSALPFTQRGTATPLNASISGITATTTSSIDFTNAVSANNVIEGLLSLSGQNIGLTKFNDILAEDGTVLYSYDSNFPNQLLFGAQRSASPNDFQSFNQSANSDLIAALNKAAITSSTSFSGSPSVNIYANDIRKLFADQQELEKMARTDGSLGGFGLTFFGEKSKNATDYKPTYIGGTYKNISFTEVLQTSGSSVGTTDPDTTSPLGAQAGHGIVGISNGRIGHIHSDDYGYIMLLVCIMPDVYYHQGLDKMWSLRSQDELYIPERARLGLIPILNKEIYFAGNNGSSSGQDNYLWAYQNPFDEFRYKANRICGQMADPNSKSFYPYTQARHFTQLPNWGTSFSQAKDIRSDYLFAPNESHFTAQFKFNVRSVRPIPYKPIPAKIV